MTLAATLVTTRSLSCCTGSLGISWLCIFEGYILQKVTWWLSLLCFIIVLLQEVTRWWLWLLLLHHYTTVNYVLAIIMYINVSIPNT